MPETMLYNADEQNGLIQRIDRVEEKVDNIEAKVGELLEQGQVTQEGVSEMGEEIKSQRDHFKFLRDALKSEMVLYKRLFLVGGFVLAFLLLWVIIRI